MEGRRCCHTGSDPKVRQVGFVTPNEQTEQAQNGCGHGCSPPVSDHSPVGTLTPVIIPPPRYPPDNISSSHGLPVARPIPVPLLRQPTFDIIPLRSHLPSDSNPACSLMLSSSSITTARDLEFSTGSQSPPGPNALKLATSYPGVGIDMAATHMASPIVLSSNVTNVAIAKLPPQLSEKNGGALVDIPSEQAMASKPSKDKMTKAERRAMQEAQRAAKSAAKDAGEGSKSLITSVAKRPQVKKENFLVVPPITSSEKKGFDRMPEKDKKKDVPHPRMQFDDMQRVGKIKKRALVKQVDAQNRVELFRHLPQYVHGTCLPELESKFFQLDPIHPSVYKVGLQYLVGDISGGNARCIAMLQAFRDVIRDHSSPAERGLVRDLTAKISNYVSFLIECRPQSVSMGNAVRFLKSRITRLPQTLGESEAKAVLQADIDSFINEKIVLADKVIVKHAVTKIQDGDVLLTYGSSSVVEMTLLCAHELGKCFHVIVADSRPKLEGQSLLRLLVTKGISCTYTHLNAISYIMHEVTRVFLGASSVLANGTVYSRVGTACVAMVAHEFRVPVLVCCEAYKFHERVQLDSICSNELGNPSGISKVHGRRDLNHLENWEECENLQLLNLLYDATPSDYVSMIVTDYGMVPPTSVSVILREYRREHLWI